MIQNTNEIIQLLKTLIATPSLSREEADTAQVIQEFLENRNIPANRHLNNIWAANRYFDESKPTILLNSHHDTVKPNPAYSRDPFNPQMENGKLFGLGSNDAGGSLVSLLATFIHFYKRKDLTYNLLMAATAEEEISGTGGITSILPKLPTIDFALVGEPTRMRMAVAEKGLLVLDCTAKGKNGHAARDEGKNAIYKALEDISWFKTYRFDNISESLGPIKMTVTLIDSGTQHNVVPGSCRFTVDIRTTDAYTNMETLDIIREHTVSEIVPRSLDSNPSFIPMNHPIVKAGIAMGIETYGSPTLSDQKFLSVPSLKMGPGKSARSHTADEFIRLGEIEEGISTYINLLNKIL